VTHLVVVCVKDTIDEVDKEPAARDELAEGDSGTGTDEIGDCIGTG